MGKRASAATTVQQQQHNSQHSLTKNSRAIRKRKRNSIAAGTPSKALRLHNAENGNFCPRYANDIEDDAGSSSSNGGGLLQSHLLDQSASLQLNSSSVVFNSSLHNTTDQSSIVNDSPRPVYTLRPSVVNGTILYDLKQKPWRLGCPIGKGNFGEIFLASSNITLPATTDNAKYVVKIEPHSNGPLFVEIHCLMNAARVKANCTDFQNALKQELDEKHQLVSYPSPTSVAAIPEGSPCGIPDYIASGSHCFGNARYRFLVLPRFDHDLHSLIKNSRVSQKCVLTLAIHILTVLENLHDRGYCHNDVKAQNLMISKCKYYATTASRKQHPTVGGGKMKANASDNALGATLKIKKFCDEDKQQTTDSGNSSEQEANDDDDETYAGSDEEEDEEEEFVMKRKANYRRNDFYEDDDEDFDDCTTTNSNISNSIDYCKTPISKNHRRQRSQVEYSGSNPVRSCRRPQRQNSIYEEMVNSHYLRPSKRISYSEFFDDDGLSVAGGSLNNRDRTPVNDSDNDSEEFLPRSAKSRASASTKKSSKKLKVASSKRLTRRQEKLLAVNNKNKLLKQALSSSSSSTSLAAHAITDNGHEPVLKEAEHIFLIDFGLASKYMERGAHRPFIMDQRRAHDGTLEFTSRDAHMGAHSRRSDLECLGYNLLFWSQGYLPWKEAASQQQQEKVHRIKEYLMANVREMLKLVYGKDVPKYLGEFLHLISKLAYNDRPNYEQYRRIFEREYQLLGYSLAEMRLSSDELKTTSTRIKKDSNQSKCDIFSMYNNNGLNLSVNGTPFQDRSLADRVSPKNLRSKTDKKAAKKKKFSWAEILSQDPDQIARERAEKEFDREEELSELQLPARQYEGKPTYAILAIEQRLRIKHEQPHELETPEEVGQDEEGEAEEEEEDDEEEEDEEEEDEEVEAANNEVEEDAESADEEEEAAEDDNDDDDEEEEAEESAAEQESDEESEDSEADSADDDELDGHDEHSNSQADSMDASSEEGVRRSKRSTKRNQVTKFGRSPKKSRSRSSRSKATNANRKAATKPRSNLTSDNDADDDTTHWMAEKQSRSRRTKTKKPRASGKASNSVKSRTSSACNKSSTAAAIHTNGNGHSNSHHASRRGGATHNKDTRDGTAQQQTNTRSVSRKFGSTRQQQPNHLSQQAASAAGEVEQNNEAQKSARAFESNLHFSRAVTNENKAPAMGGRERRTRRGITKSDMELMDVDDSSNSNFGHDMRTIYNVWKKISTENMYYTASAITTGRHSTRK